MKLPSPHSLKYAALAALILSAAPRVQAQETVLQYFNTSWREIERRLPEVAEAGYSALWLPPPNKGSSGTYSVGYDVFDRFDLGDKDQMGTVATRYGTKADLLRLVEVAHRFGIRVYFDNVMAHNAGPLDDVAPGTLFPSIPGFVPEDFHLVRKAGGGWRKATDSLDYNDEWQVLNRNPFAWDIAQESPNTSFDPVGQAEGTDYAKWTGIRHPGKRWLYPDTDLPGMTDAAGIVFRPFADKEPWQDTGWGAAHTGAGNGKFDWDDTNANGQHEASEAGEPFTDTGVDPTTTGRNTVAWGFGDGKYNMGNPVAEDVNGMLLRATRWIIDQTGCDGFRLDAVKHVPSYFFGQQTGLKDGSSAGYLGNAQAQFNLTHNYSDWSNHRDSTYSTNVVRDDLMLFGEHLGAPPAPGDYLAAGMRIANDDFVNGVGGLSGIGNSMSGYDTPGLKTFGVNEGVMYCLSHDNNYMSGSDRPAAHQYMLTRAGLPIVYTDGYNVSGAPDYFPKPSYVPFLGQFGQNYITGTLPVRRDFARGDQIAKYQGTDFCAWEFRDKSENLAMSDADGTTMLIMHARAYTSGQPMPMSTTFPRGHRLRNYSPYGGTFYAWVDSVDGKLHNDQGAVITVPSGGYFAFSYEVPELPTLWQGSTEARAIDITENGTPVSWMGVARKDGKNGDAAYNYTAQVPRVKSGTVLTFTARADGTTANILMKLDGGIDLNGVNGRDNKPGTAKDTFLGYEQMTSVQRVSEKFAATDTLRNVLGSAGAETWQYTVGTAGVVRNNGGGINTNTGTATWAYHDPTAQAATVGSLQMSPAAATAAGQAVTFQVKVGYKADAITNAWLYYTTDGTNFPEGSAGLAKGTTKVLALGTPTDGAADGGGIPQWWRGTLPAQTAGTVVRYKIGIHKLDAPVRFPLDDNELARKRKMETVFRLANFNATTAKVYTHADNGQNATGLKEGFHYLQTRAFLKRDNQASLFRTNTQTFYYDTQRPTGQIIYPTNDLDTIGGTTYGVVVLTDDSVTEVRYNITDTSTANDSAANGNGTGNWATATEVTPATSTGTTGFTKQWRFDYKQIPGSGQAIIKARVLEASSSADMTKTDVDGWFTTLSRTVNTGYAVNYRIAFPAADGTVVDSTYVMKVLFDKSLGYFNAVQVSETQMKAEFQVGIASSVSGAADGEIIQSASRIGFNRDENATESALTFTFPNLYNGNPDFLHRVRATHTRGGISLTDTVLVKAAPAALADADADGLPDFWENLYGLQVNNPDGIHGADGDFDGDGISNVAEYLTGLNPIAMDAEKYPQPKLTTGVNGASYRLEFPVLRDRSYRVQYSSGLASWITAGSVFQVTADNPAFLWTDDGLLTDPDPVNEKRRFYRVLISTP